ncbi:MAG: VIT1/CCC1 transporter family protein [Candidatus Komeilibacteria bacterium]
MGERHDLGFVHHRSSAMANAIREVVFGMEDGMVSTLGAITGIAVGSHSSFMVLLSGLVIIMVESISMGVGSYLSNRSAHDIDKRKLGEEEFEIKHFLPEEAEEMLELFQRDGWPDRLAMDMAKAASQDKDLMLKEMAYRELNVYPYKTNRFSHNAWFMFTFYILGGFIPLSAYIFFPLQPAMIISVILTLLGLFILGAVVTKYTRQLWWKGALRMLLLGGLALAVGYTIGRLGDMFLAV